MTESFDIAILQIDGMFTSIAQQGIAFTLLIIIIYVLGRRVAKLEKKIEDMIAEEKKEAKENILIIKGATEAMQLVAKKLE